VAILINFKKRTRSATAQQEIEKLKSSAASKPQTLWRNLMQPFLAMIIPVGGGEPGYPAHPIAPGGPPPGIWPGPGYPAHPIAPGGPPPGIWPGPGYPAHPIAPGGPPPWVSHPIPPTVWPNPPGQGPGNPPGFWGGTPPLYPDHGLPGQPPGIWGGRPPWLDNTLPQPQPPGTPPGEGDTGRGNWGYSPVYGWVWVPSGEGGKPHPPSVPGGGSGNRPDHTLPGDLPHPDQGLPAGEPHPEPHT
jgi:hypothetical protein